MCVTSNWYIQVTFSHVHDYHPQYMLLSPSSSSSLLFPTYPCTSKNPTHGDPAWTMAGWKQKEKQCWHREQRRDTALMMEGGGGE